VTEAHGVCPFYWNLHCRCKLTGKGCLCDLAYQSHCTRREWAIEYQKKAPGHTWLSNDPFMQP
jgi:hypothetical protein